MINQEEEVKHQQSKTIKDIDVKIDYKLLRKVDDNKQPVSVVFVGHENVGKSTISG